jgi:hypothetical protein
MRSRRAINVFRKQQHVVAGQPGPWRQAPPLYSLLTLFMLSASVNVSL